MKISTTLYLLWVGSFAATAQAAITWHPTCNQGGRKEKVTQAFADASRMASTVITQWGSSLVTKSLKGYFSGVSPAQQADIKEVFAKIARLNTYNFNIFCIHTYDDPTILGLSKCGNREVAYVDVKDQETTNDMYFCPVFFASAINKFLDESKAEICSLNPSKTENPLPEFSPAGDVPAGTYNRNYDQMIEWLAHAFPGKWALHELTHTLAIGDHLTSTKTMLGGGTFQKKGTTDVELPGERLAYGKRKVKELKGTNAYQNADSYAWMAWTVYRDVCQKGATQGEACALEKRAGTGTGKGKGKGGAATPGKGPGKGPCNGKPPAKKPPVKNPAVKNPANKNPPVKNPPVKNPPVKTPLKKPAPGGKRPAPGGKRPVPGGKRPGPAGKRPAPAVKKPAIKKPAAKKPAAKKPAAKKRPAA